MAGRTGKNKKVCLADVERSLYDHGTATAKELGRRLGFSGGAMRRALIELEKKGAVKRQSVAAGLGYEFRPMAEPQWRRDRDAAVESLATHIKRLGIAAWVKSVGPMVTIEMSWTAATCIDRELQKARES